MSHRLLIVGWGRSGKDEAAGFFNDHLGLPYAGSTSWAALPLMAVLQNLHPQLAWERRHANRQFWKDSCDEFRKNEPTLLMERAFRVTPHGRVVTGIRDKVEIDAAKEAKLFRNIIWIDRPGVPVDPTVTFTAADATDYVRNDGSLRRFHKNLIQWTISVGLNPPKFSAYAAEVYEDLDP